VAIFSNENILSAIFSSQSTLGAIFARISGSLPRIPQMLPRFSPDEKFWVCAWTPCTPASYTTALSRNCERRVSHVWRTSP